jgi:molecular chaperone GrpE (heat shock protein)
MEDTIDREDGEVIREFVPGYMFKDRVVRHAKVLIARRNDDIVDVSVDE